MNSQEQEFFSQLVYTYSGIALGPDKTYLFENRLSEVAKAIGCPSLSDLYRRAKFNMTNDLRDRIIEAMTTNETLFFRDSAPFDALRAKIIPDIIKRKVIRVKLLGYGVQHVQQDRNHIQYLCYSMNLFQMLFQIRV